MFHSNVAPLLWISEGGVKESWLGKMWEKGFPFKEKNISSEMESYSVIIQKLH